MPTTKEIFALRKEGRIDEALNLAKSLYSMQPEDEWTVRAYAWCLYDKTKALLALNNYSEAKVFGKTLEDLPIDSLDDILYSSVQRIILNLNPQRKLISEAKEKSKEGNHQASIDLLRQAKVHFQEDKSIDESIAWEIYRLRKNIFEQKPIPVIEAKKVLAEYIALNNPRPSVIHSIFLRLSDRIIESDGFNSIQFVKLWDLKNLREEDYEPYVIEEKKFPSLGEKLIQHVAKQVVNKRLSTEVDYFLPFLESAIKRFPDNIWLNYYKVKFLQLLNKNEEALKFVIPIAKIKSDEWWTWGLLGELYLEIDRKKSLSCFCKALLCKSEEKFLTNTRIRLAQILIEESKLSEAKTEIELAINTRQKEGYAISGLLSKYPLEPWFLSAAKLESNAKLYKENKGAAEQILFEDLPWINISMGEQYVTEKKPDKPRRKIYAALKDSNVEEFSVSVSKLKGYKINSTGAPFKMKAEKDKEGKLKIYMIESRIDGLLFDIFPKRVGNITSVIKKEGKIEAVNLVFKDDAKVIEWRSKNPKVFDGVTFKQGEPISIVVSKRLVKEKDTNGLSYYIPKMKTVYDILEVKTREGELFDCVECKLGIVDHINSEKGIFHFIVSKSISGIGKITLCNDKLEVGDTVSVRPIEINGENGKYFQTLTCVRSEQEAPLELKKKYSGMLDEQNGFGFVDDIFVAGHLLKNLELGEVPFVSGEAILNYNKKRGTWGWAAINCESL